MTIAFPKPDEGVLARRDEILAGLARLVAPEALVTSEDERRAFETDALTAYRKMPLAVVLPSTTAEVSAVLKFCHAHGVKVVPRGAGTSLCGGAIPQEDAIILGVAKMNRVLEIGLREPGGARAGRRHQPRPSARRSPPKGFFYAPDPSSQLACTIAGNIAMNSGGAHCLKYGVTTNNLLGVTMVLLDGTVVEIGGKHLDSAGYDLLGLICGSEGQLGVVTEATVRILRAAEGARPALMGFDSAETAGACVAAIIGAGIIPVAMEYMDRLAIEISEAFAHAGYPLDVEAMLIIEVEGSDAEIEDMLNRIVEIAKPFNPKSLRVAQSEAESRRDLEGPQVRLRRDGPHLRLPLHGRHHPDRATSLRAQAHRARSATATASRSPTCSTPATATCIRSSCSTSTSRARCEKAEAAGEDILKLCVEVGGCLTGEHGVGIEKRDLMTFQFNAGGPAAADARARRVRPGVAAQSRQGVPAGRAAGGLDATVILARRPRAGTREHRHASGYDPVVVDSSFPGLRFAGSSGMTRGIDDLPHPLQRTGRRRDRRRGRGAARAAEPRRRRHEGGHRPSGADRGDALGRRRSRASRCTSRPSW